MALTYGIGLHHLVPPGAEVLNANPVEDLGFEIQSHFDLDDFEAREIFPPRSRLLMAERSSWDAAPLIYVWRDGGTAGLDPAPPEGLQESATDLLANAGSGSIPASDALPDPIADILVPGWPVSPERPVWKNLHRHVEPLEAAKRFVGRPVRPPGIAVCLVWTRGGSNTPTTSRRRSPRTWRRTSNLERAARHACAPVVDGG